ncbi:MAG: hypothetical protein ACLQVY_15795 [Limisphaerales bacterium]
MRFMHCSVAQNKGHFHFQLSSATCQWDFFQRFEKRFDQTVRTVLTTAMGNRAKNKARFSAQIFKVLAAGIQQWLELYPDANRTDFVLRALAGKLWRSGVEPMREFLEDQVKPRAEAFAPQKIAKMSDIPGASDQILVSAWLDRKILTEVDRWIQETRPRMTRTMFFQTAAAEQLMCEGIVSDALGYQFGALNYQQTEMEILPGTIGLPYDPGDRPRPGRRSPYSKWPREKLKAHRDGLLARLRKINAVLGVKPNVPARN